MNDLCNGLNTINVPDFGAVSRQFVTKMAFIVVVGPPYNTNLIIPL